MSEWITDRSPAKEDADKNGQVIVACDLYDSGWSLEHWKHTGGNPWRPLSPYQPLEPDTSLSASIGRVENSDWSGSYFDSELFSQDHARIIEAAKKWDAMANQGKCVQGFTKGDIAESEHGKKYEERTGATSYNELFGLGSHPKDPSMAVSPGENCGAEGQAETQPRERSSNPQDKPWHPDCKCGAIEKEECACACGSEKPKRREWWVETGSRNPKSFNDAWYAWGMNSTSRPQDYTHVREVLPGDPDPEWVEELIRLCERLDSERPGTIDAVRNFATKRGEK